MPTGYTAKLHDGVEQTFEEFVLECARAFSVSQRDDPPGPIREPSPGSSYYARSLVDAEVRLIELLEMDLEQAEEAARMEHQEAVEREAAADVKTMAMKERYEEMLERVREWEPPSERHVGLRDFMIQQLEGSIEHDCESHFRYSREPELLSGEKWLDQNIARAKDNIAYYKKEDMEERERYARDVHWVKQLKESLA